MVDGDAEDDFTREISKEISKEIAKENLPEGEDKNAHIVVDDLAQWMETSEATSEKQKTLGSVVTVLTDLIRFWKLSRSDFPFSD